MLWFPAAPDSSREAAILPKAAFNSSPSAESEMLLSPKIRLKSHPRLPTKMSPVLLGSGFLSLAACKTRI